METTKDKYFESDWKVERHPNDQKNPSAGFACIAYCIITKEFEQTLNNKFDNGSALISNVIKNIGLVDAIKHVGRDNNCIAVNFTNAETMWTKSNEELIEIANNIFDEIIKSVEMWKSAISDSPDEFVPLYSSGSRYKADAMYGMITDVCISYNRNSCIYSVMFNHDVYNNYVKDNYKYFDYIMSNVMRCINGIRMHDKECILMAVDPNIGTGPTEDRANAIATAAMFAVMCISQLMQLRE